MTTGMEIQFRVHTADFDRYFFVTREEFLHTQYETLWAMTGMMDDDPPYLEVHPISSSLIELHGDYHGPLDRIRIFRSHSLSSDLATLVHEVAHAIDDSRSHRSHGYRFRWKYVELAEEFFGVTNLMEQARIAHRAGFAKFRTWSLCDAIDHVVEVLAMDYVHHDRYSVVFQTRKRFGWRWDLSVENMRGVRMDGFVIDE